jgi:hypothetical protein
MEVIVAILLMSLLGLAIAVLTGAYKEEPWLAALIIIGFAFWGLGIGLNFHGSTCKNAEVTTNITYFELESISEMSPTTYLRVIDSEDSEGATIFVYSVAGEQVSITTDHNVVNTLSDSHNYVEIIDNTYVNDVRGCKTLTDTYIFHLTEGAMYVQ